MTETAGHTAAPQGVYPCAGDDEWVAVAVASDEQWRSLRALLGESIVDATTTSRLRPVAALHTTLSIESCHRGPAGTQRRRSSRCSSTRASHPPS